MRARSSMVEHRAYTSAVLGSSPSARIYFLTFRTPFLYLEYTFGVLGSNPSARIYFLIKNCGHIGRFA